MGCIKLFSLPLLNAPDDCLVFFSHTYFDPIPVQKKCTIMEMPDVPMKLDSYYDIKAVLIMLAAFSLHVLLAYVPLRSKVLPNGAKARGNGESNSIL